MTSCVKVPQVSCLDPDHIPFKVYSDDLLTKCNINVSNVDTWTTAQLPKADVFVHVAASPPSTSQSTDGNSKPSFEVDSQIDALVDGVFSELVQRHQFNGKEGKQCSARVGKDSHFTNAVLMGVGNPSTHVDCDYPSFIYCQQPSSCTVPTANRCHSASAAGRLGRAVAGALSGIKATSAVVSLKDICLTHRAVQSFIECMILGLMNDDRFKSKKTPKPACQVIQSIEIRMSSTHTPTDCKSLIESAKKCVSGIDLAKQLTTAPPNYCNPASMAKAADEMAKALSMDCEILDMAALEERKMGAFVAVGKGSIFPPHLIHLTYKGQQVNSDTPLKRLAFVGKGLTMDTGGYNLKVAGMIELMKWDMGGAAAVLGAARAVGELKIPGVEVHFIVGAAENMVSSKAYRPGDVLTASNGTTIEVGNTDAEGRLVLCDCLVFAEKLGVDCIVDMATLTGSCIIGLGRNVGALYGTSSPAVSLMLQSAHDSGESLWPMPLCNEYRSDIDSRCADLCNMATSRFGGTIHAALFLREFVKTTPWCHIDLAGPAWDYKDHTGTGFGVRTVVEFCSKVASGKHCLKA